MLAASFLIALAFFGIDPQSFGREHQSTELFTGI